MQERTDNQQRTPSLVLSSEDTMTGMLHVNGDVRFEAVLDGNLEVAGHVELIDAARIRGSLRCTTLTLAGEVAGDVHVESCARIRSSGRVGGTIHATTVQFDDGAQFSGTMVIGPAATRTGCDADVKNPSTTEPSSSLRGMASAESRLRARLAAMHPPVGSCDHSGPRAGCPKPLVR
ncbi:MAG: polymer-forming cytoskeletal protein [Phycisphaerales bacterium]|nr:polymer-forming cytoskeletal protein [Phycisphaerales bacterium]